MSSRTRPTTRARGRSTPRRSARGRFIVVFLGVLIAVVLGSIALLGRSATNQRTTAPVSTVVVSDLAVPPNAEAQGRAWGPPDAPIQVIEYADYECEACGFFAREYEAAFVDAFANSGKVRFEIRNAPFHGEGARNAAEAAYCAADQNAFWRMHDSLFLNQPTIEGTGPHAFSDARLQTIAGKLGVDTAAFGQCLTSNTYAAQVAQDYNATVQAGIRQTPTFVINGRPYPGVLSVDDFRQIFAQVAPGVTLD